MKRAFDVVISMAALVLLSPLLAVVALVVLLDDGRPVIFRQNRVGLHNETFRIRKFRTMRKDTEHRAQHEMQGRDCYTRTGRLLRALSLDELPQLWNVLEGSMSLVGPRPLIPEEDDIRQLRAQAGVYDVLPGMTGWAQVNGRAHVTAEEKVALDVEYIHKKNLWFDVKILLKTIFQVLKREDVD